MVRFPRPLWLLLTLALLAAGCETTADPEAGTAAAADVRTVAATTAVAVERPISRFVAVTGTLAAQEQADVAAEIAGRIVSTPVERGTRVSAGAALVQIADTEVRAQADEAGANAAQIEARLGLAGGGRVRDRPRPGGRQRPRLVRARAGGVRSRPDARREEAAAAGGVRQEPRAGRRGPAPVRHRAQRRGTAVPVAARRARADDASRARRSPTPSCARRSTASSTSGSCRWATTSSRGTKVASVMRTTPLRVELTVPGQYISTIAAGRSVSLEVDAYPGRTFTGRIRYVSPAVQADSRALIIEAVVPNETGELKPGLFATARIEQASQTPAVLVPGSAVRTDSDTARVYRGVSDRLGGGAHRHHRSDGGRPDRDHQRRQGGRHRGHEQRRAARRRRAHHAGRGSPPCSGSPLSAFAGPVFASVLILSLTVIGGFSFTQLGIDQFPNVDFPDDPRHHAPARRRAGAGRERSHRQDRGGRQHHQRHRHAHLDLV